MTSGEGTRPASELRVRIWLTWPRWRRVVGVVGPLVVVVNAVLGAVTHQPLGLEIFRVAALLAVALLAAFNAGAIVVTPQEIREPFRRRVSWGDVVAVEKATVFSDNVVLVLASGRRHYLQLPARYTDEVARLGGREPA